MKATVEEFPNDDFITYYREPPGVGAVELVYYPKSEFGAVARVQGKMYQFRVADLLEGCRGLAKIVNPLSVYGNYADNIPRRASTTVKTDDHSNQLRPAPSEFERQIEEARHKFDSSGKRRTPAAVPPIDTRLEKKLHDLAEQYQLNHLRQPLPMTRDNGLDPAAWWDDYSHGSSHVCVALENGCKNSWCSVCEVTRFIWDKGTWVVDRRD